MSGTKAEFEAIAAKVQEQAEIMAKLPDDKKLEVYARNVFTHTNHFSRECSWNALNKCNKSQK